MNETNELMTLPEQNGGKVVLAPEVQNHLDAKQLRTAHVGKLLDSAYQGASTLKLKPNEVKELTEPFPDEAVEIRSFDGIIFLPHMLLRERLWKVFGPTEVAEICRERAMRQETSEIMVDLVLMARGKFLAEAIGTAKWFPNNPKQSFGDAIESAWSEALRRCCKRIMIGTNLWQPQYIRDWLARNAVQHNGKWYRKDNAPVTAAHRPPKTKEYIMKETPSEFQKMKAAVQATDPVDEDGDPIPF